MNERCETCMYSMCFTDGSGKDLATCKLWPEHTTYSQHHTCSHWGVYTTPAPAPAPPTMAGRPVAYLSDALWRPGESLDRLKQQVVIEGKDGVGVLANITGVVFLDRVPDWADQILAFGAWCGFQGGQEVWPGGDWQKWPVELATRIALPKDSSHD